MDNRLRNYDLYLRRGDGLRPMRRRACRKARSVSRSLATSPPRPGDAQPATPTTGPRRCNRRAMGHKHRIRP